MNHAGLSGRGIINYATIAIFVLFAASPAFAEGMGTCVMCGAMGWGGMLLGGIIGIALLALIVVGIVYLVKKTRQLPM